MDSFTTWMLRGLSAKQNKSRLSQVSNLIDWSPIRQILDEMYDSQTSGGAPRSRAGGVFKIIKVRRMEGQTAMLSSCSRFSYFSGGMA
jgi:hypothetical protein